MKRKVLRVGNASLAVSLPNRWVKQHGIAPGQEIDVFEEGNLILSNGSSHAERTAQISLDGYGYYVLVRHLTVLYRSSYDRITVTFDDPTILQEKTGKRIPVHAMLQELVRRFVGGEIVSQSERSIEIEFFAQEEEKSLEKIELRIYFLMKETLSSMLSPGFEASEAAMYGMHDNIAKFINFYLRLLHRVPMDEQERSMAYAVHIMLDMMADKTRHLAERMRSDGCTERVRAYLAEAFTLFAKAYSVIQTRRTDAALVSARYDLLRRMREEDFSQRERHVIDGVIILLDTFNNFFELAHIRRALHGPIRHSNQ